MSLIAFISALSGGSSGTPPPPPPSTGPLLIVFAGESNSGGLGDNTLLTTTEAGSRNLKLLNNTTLAGFDNLNIGANNNLIGHHGFDGTWHAHGWENQLANRYDAGAFGTRTVYLAKCGQGGTKISEWGIGATYDGISPYTLFLNRVNAAVSLITTLEGEAPQIIIFWSQGINDAVATPATGLTTWKTATKAVFNQMRTDLGMTAPIFTTQFQSITGAGDMSGYNSTIATMATEMSSIYVINTTGREVSQVLLAAGNHWGYTGLKGIADDLINAYLAL
jgi:hypothetical protein